MKIFYLFLALMFCISNLFSQTLFTYGNNSVSKEEFLRAYNKNKNVATNKQESLKEYLDLYINFKLKVKAAKDLRLDTLSQLKYDLENFRNQIAENYMNNEKAVNDLIDEAFYRSQRDLHILHFYIPFNETMKPGDTLRAYEAMKQLQGIKHAKAYPDGVEGVVAAISRIYPIKTADLGFISAFSIPYEYENIIYKLKPEDISSTYRSKKGLHVFKLIEERKNIGKWKVAQILLLLPPGNSIQNTELLKQKADSIYIKLQRGENFAKLAKEYSEDKATYFNGGEMPEFGTGKFSMLFEQEVIKLKKDGEISQPFLTEYGYHIIKKVSQTEVPNDINDIGFRFDLKQKIIEDARINSIKETFARGIIKKIGYKKNTSIKDTTLFRYVDNAIADSATGKITKNPLSNKTIFRFTKTAITGLDWLNFVKEYKQNIRTQQLEDNSVLLQKFISAAALDYYKRHLEEYDTDFRFQIEEFKEGNILFEVMERKIWSTAANDSVNLLKYYNNNKNKYIWNASADVIVFNCTNITTASEAFAALKKGKDWKKISGEAGIAIQADSGRYELTQIPVSKEIKIIPGDITNPIVNSNDGSASFIKTIKLYDSNMQRSFDEARGMIINDYQNLLEDKWITELKSKYPIKINNAIFNSLLK